MLGNNTPFLVLVPLLTVVGASIMGSAIPFTVAEQVSNNGYVFTAPGSTGSCAAYIAIKNIPPNVSMLNLRCCIAVTLLDFAVDLYGLADNPKRVAESKDCTVFVKKFNSVHYRKIRFTKRAFTIS